MSKSAKDYLDGFAHGYNPFVPSPEGASGSWLAGQAASVRVLDSCESDVANYVDDVMERMREHLFGEDEK